MHPYQGQINRMWELIKLRNRALKNKFWLEAVDLTYILFEVELRLLLTSKAGKQGMPFPPSYINKMEYLKDLADLAKEKEFLSSVIHGEVMSFNKARRKVIHGFIQGKIEYSELEKVCKEATNAIYKIESLWFPIIVGPEERVQ